MIEKYFSAPKTLRRLRAGLSGPYIDGFAKSLAEDGYAHATAIRYLRAAARLGVFVQRRDGVLAEIDVNTLQAFRRHLIFGRCPRGSGGKTGYHAHFGVKLFYQYLIQRGICPTPPPATDAERAVPPLVSSFATWYQRHRGITQPTARLYSRGATQLLAGLGEDVRTWSVHSLREFLLDQANQGGAESTQKLITSLRAFLRYLSFCGEARADLDRAIPAIAHWRLASLPPCLSVDELKRLFLRSIAPFRPFVSGDGVSGVVSKALQRAGIEAPTQGAHLLRHTAATEMLRNGVPLDRIGLVLRHRSIDMSAYYAKVDVAQLRQIAQLWPEVKP